jgi:hypothetical protein
MKYLLLFANSEENRPKRSDEELKAFYERIGQWWGKHSAAGTIVGGEELQPAGTATTVRINGDQAVVTDGPFMEAKETIGGFSLIEVPDLDAAIELAKTWPAGGTVEIRPVVTEENH